MANPQKKNGFTQVSNQILEALIASSLSGQDFKILLLVIRKTYGFHKLEDAISLSQMMAATGMGKVRCSQVVNRLQLMKLLTVTENINGISKKYKFNKDFEAWQTINKNINRIEKTKSTVKEKLNQPLRKLLTTKETFTKETITKDKIYSSESDEVRLSELLYNFIVPRNLKFKKPNFQKWAVHVDQLIKADKRTPEEIEAVITWCQQDAFWKNNILSTLKLRKQFDQLFLKAGQRKRESLHEKILKEGRAWLSQKK